MCSRPRCLTRISARAKERLAFHFDGRLFRQAGETGPAGVWGSLALLPTQPSHWGPTSLDSDSPSPHLPPSSTLLPLGTGSQSNVADLFSGSTKFTAEFFFILGFHHNDYSQNIRVSQAMWMAGKSLTCTWVCPSCVRSCTASPAEAAGERWGHG